MLSAADADAAVASCEQQQQHARTMYSSVTFIYKSNDKPTKSQLKFQDECEPRNYQVPGISYLGGIGMSLFFLFFFSFFFSYVSTRSIEASLP